MIPKYASMNPLYDALESGTDLLTCSATNVNLVAVVTRRMR